MRPDFWIMLDLFLQRYPGYTAEDVLNGDAEVIERLMFIALACAEARAQNG